MHLLFPPEIWNIIFSFDSKHKETMNQVIYQLKRIPLLQELKDNIHFGCFKHYIKNMETSGMMIYVYEEERNRYIFRSDHYFGWKKGVFTNAKIFGFQEKDRNYYWKRFWFLQKKKKNEFYV